MATPDYTPRPANLRFDFNKAAKKLVEEHPQLKSKTIFINLTTGERKGPLLARLRAKFKLSFRRNIELARKKKLMTTRGDAHAVRDSGGYAALAMTTDRYFKFVNGPGATLEMDDLFVLRHEAAHIIVKAAQPGIPGEYFNRLFAIAPSRRETAADVYAVMRHLQQFGTDRAPIETVPLRRALSAIHYDQPDYFTTFAVDAVLRDAKALVAQNLTPEQTAAKVEGYVERYVPSREQTDALRRDFAPLKGIMYTGSKDNQEPLKKLADIALSPKSSPLSFYLANRILGALIGKTLNGPEWVETAKKLHAKEAEMTLDKIFPAVQPQAPAKTKPKR